ncbi:hypothetical protein MAMMFC1_01199 [Methylomusa anaerophila]|uniref:Uncharacterized protein n=1 Tax=Methylomusa anaerophila TaxID=1930071 RepID=A0A348AHJ7_9FIRM|nr:hypothetical protein MAMMFC1_01199 [Methylomusa anaerophila]
MAQYHQKFLVLDAFHPTCCSCSLSTAHLAYLSYIVQFSRSTLSLSVFRYRNWRQLLYINTSVILCQHLYFVTVVSSCRHQWRLLYSIMYYSMCQPIFLRKIIPQKGGECHLSYHIMPAMSIIIHTILKNPCISYIHLKGRLVSLPKNPVNTILLVSSQLTIATNCLEIVRCEA